MSPVLRSASLLLAVATILGCSSWRNAERALERMSPLACDDTPVRSASACPDLRGYSLEQLVAFAITNRPSMASAACEVEDARLALRQLSASAPVLCTTHSNLLDSISLTLSGGYSAVSDSAQHFDQLEWRTEGSSSADLSLELLLFDFGRHDASMRSQAEQVVAAELSLIGTGYEVFYEVSEAYFGFLKSGALLEVARTNEQMRAEHLEQARTLFDNGEAKKLDVLRAQLDYAQARESTVTAVNTVRRDIAVLMTALGVAQDHAVDVQELRFTSDAFTCLLRGFGDSSWTAESLHTFASTNAPAIRVARARLRAAMRDVEYAQADLLPEVSASVTTSWSDPLWLWNWGVRGAWSLFEGFRRTTALDRAVVALEKAKCALDEQEQQLAESVHLVIVARDNAREAMVTSEESLVRARENLELVREEYQVGDASRVDYTDAVNDYVDALGGRIKAFYNGQQAEAAIWRLAGAQPVYQQKTLCK